MRINKTCKNIVFPCTLSLNYSMHICRCYVGPETVSSKSLLDFSFENKLLFLIFVNKIPFKY